MNFESMQAKISREAYHVVVIKKMHCCLFAIAMHFPFSIALFATISQLYSYNMAKFRNDKIKKNRQQKEEDKNMNYHACIDINK